MAAIYRFGFENLQTPAGVTLSTTTFGPGRYANTRAAWSGSITSGGKSTPSPVASTAVSVSVPVSGTKAYASFFCWLTGDSAYTHWTDTDDYTIASYYGNSVGFSRDSLWIKTVGGVTHRISKEELAGYYMVYDTKYFTTVAFELGPTGHISLYWDGLTIEYSGDTGAVPADVTQLTMYCPNVANSFINHGDRRADWRWDGSIGSIDDIAVNDGNGNIDITTPGPIACFVANSINAVLNSGWSPTSLSDINTTLASGYGVTAVAAGSKLALGYICNPPITKTGFEGINVYCNGLAKTGAGKIGMRVGLYENGSVFPKGSDINLSYQSTTRSFSVLYPNNEAQADPQNLTKYSVTDGEALAIHYEVI